MNLVLVEISCRHFGVSQDFLISPFRHREAFNASDLSGRFIAAEEMRCHDIDAMTFETTKTNRKSVIDLLASIP